MQQFTAKILYYLNLVAKKRKRYNTTAPGGIFYGKKARVGSSVSSGA